MRKALRQYVCAYSYLLAAGRQDQQGFLNSREVRMMYRQERDNVNAPLDAVRENESESKAASKLCRRVFFFQDKKWEEMHLEKKLHSDKRAVKLTLLLAAVSCCFLSLSTLI